MAAILPVEEHSDDEEGVWQEFDRRLWVLFSRTAGHRPGFYFFFTELTRAEQRDTIRLFAAANGSRRRIAQFWQRLDQQAAAIGSRVFERFTSCYQHAGQRSRSRSSRRQQGRGWSRRSRSRSSRRQQGSRQMQ